MVNRAEMAFITLSSLMQSHSHRGCPFYPATSSLGLIQNAAWRLLTFDRQSGRLPRHNGTKGEGEVAAGKLPWWEFMNGHGAWMSSHIARCTWNALKNPWNVWKATSFWIISSLFFPILRGEFRNYISCNFAQLPTKCEHTKVEQVRVYCCFCFCFVFGVSL